jgi:uncharacterized SAM-binding protein YcdF (DUF218 family)
MGFVSLISHGFRMLLPFSERIAIRIIIFSAIFGLIGFIGGATSLALWAEGASAALTLALLSAAAIVLAVAIGGTSFIFFATFNQTRAITLRAANSEPRRRGVLEHSNGIETSNVR